MKLAARFIFFAILSLLLGLAFFSNTALAKSGPHIGPIFPENTDACASCHRIHTASGVYLLAEGTTIFGFCTSCHNGSGANTNVLQGRFEGTVTDFDTHTEGVPGNGLNAGGYIYAYSYTGRNSRTSGWAQVTSRHNINGLDTDTYYIAWGGGSVGPGFQIALDCTSCHNPHGTENADGSERYRILRNEVNGVDVATIKAHEEISHNYTSISYRDGIAGFCIACHTQYIKKSSYYDAGDGQGLQIRVRHSVPMYISRGDVRTGNQKTIAQNLNEHIQLPLEQTVFSDQASGDNRLTCLTCHQVHGTNVDNSENAKVAPANSTTLLRLKNRGVCQNCHQR